MALADRRRGGARCGAGIFEVKPAGAQAARRIDGALSQRAREPRLLAGKQYDAGASRPMPHKDVQYERENAFID
ncbi:hypothetical protein GCM10011400_15850 [Paraburkholderia caffeinilytica]|uniref:Uncharacterized protein n=1 Tax=Paraburkholderia caffeinilytica TaxID=1761016 RepID=A0ABQ1LW87_9BURK|nr:hypothetical protein GCM10011400_15850 [Paraburkholderia caffeinilytica]